MRIHKAIPTLLTTALVGVGLMAYSAPVSASTTWPGHYSAPYVDISLYPTFNLTQAAQQSGSKLFTLGFVLNVGATCNAGWSNYTSLDAGFMQSDIASLRAAGGDVAISVGGANGTEPASSCTSPASLQAQYQRIIDRYHISHLDFDVEGGALADSASIDRRNKAIAGLEHANADLKVSYTLPVLTTALTQEGVGVLTNAVTNGARIDVVNMMTMDYGTPNSQMGLAAETAATALVSQLGGIFTGKSAAQLWAMVGITPMIGQNDSAGEIFTVADAQNVLSFATAYGISELAFWSAGRDNGNCAALSYASATCSGLAQSQWAFTSAFAKFDSASAGTVASTSTSSPTSSAAPTSTATSAQACSLSAWSAVTAYSGSAAVSYAGHQWTAKWWTQGDVPGDNSQNVWADAGSCAAGAGTSSGSAATSSPSSSGSASSSTSSSSPTSTPSPTSAPTTPSLGCSSAAWSSSSAYAGSAVTTYGGHQWTAKWWTQGDVPGANSQNVWADSGTCGTSTSSAPASSGCTVVAWSAATAYSGGAVVSYGSHRWTAKWWTQGDKPGANSQNVWADNGSC
jgi:chitinase